MNNFNRKDPLFSSQNLAAAIQIWNRAAISLLDIRHHLISPADAFSGYRLPASAFVFTSGGRAEVRLGDVPYQISRFGLFHAGKGTELSVAPQCDWLEYYTVLYKAGEPSTRKREYARLLEQINPFQQQYGFMPANPVFLSELLRKMYEKWNGPTPLNLFYGKTAFYQLIYEVYEELEKGGVAVFQPDIVAMAKSYIEQSFAQSITIQSMAEVFNVSYSHLHRLFSREMGRSPQEYLMQVRLHACKDWLEHSKLSMREIAVGTGFSDEYHFSRMFARHVGVTPGEYRKKMTSHTRDSAIGNGTPFPYNYQENKVNLLQQEGKGATDMRKQIKGKAIVAAALSLLLLSACSTAPQNTSPQSSSISSSTSQLAEEADPLEQETKIVSTTMGDVEVPKNPKRVIVQYLMGDIVALDVIPVGITEVHKGAAFEDRLKDSAYLSQWEFEPEAIMKMEPDLILLASDTQYNDMAKIAPTVLVPYGTMSMQERVTFLGEVLSREREAKAALAQYADAVSSGKEKLAQAGLANATVSTMQVTDSLISVAGNKHSLGKILYDELGLKAPKAVQEEIIDAGEYWGGNSMELLHTYCGEYVFHMGEVEEGIVSNAVWQAVPAVQAGNVFVMNTALTFYSDISSSTAMVNNAVEQLLNAQNK